LYSRLVKAGGKGLRRCGSSQGAGIRVGEVNVGGGGYVRKGWIQGSVIYIVALNPLKEHSKAAPDNRLSISGEIVGKADSRLPGVVFVLDIPRGKPLTPANLMPLR
jgi:hypothetical protein